MAVIEKVAALLGDKILITRSLGQLGGHINAHTLRGDSALDTVYVSIILLCLALSPR